MRPPTPAAALRSLAGLALGVALPAVAHAQSPATTAPTAAAPAPTPTPAPVTPAPATETAPEVAEAARGLFREGAQLALQGHWEEARDRFRRAVALRPSALLRFNLAVAAQNSGHLVEALDQYRQFLHDDSDPANAIRRQEAQAAIAAIEPVLARVVITVQGDDAPAELRLDGRALPPALLGVPVPLDPGDHVLEARGVRGGSDRQSLALVDGQNRAVVLTLRAPAAQGTGTSTARPGTPPRAQATQGTATAAQPGSVQRAPASTIDRVRRAIEEHASTVDAFGRRRWQRTFVVEAFQGTGTPLGLFGLGLRWAARPWIEFEARGGAGHPFGPGLGLFVNPRFPWSYRYGIGLSLGIATNFTTLDRGDPHCPSSHGESVPFTPVWFMAAVTHEWRASSGFAFRLALGARYLFNNTELVNAVNTQCGALRTAPDATEYLFDRPTLDHSSVPVLPWVQFDVGYGL